MEYYTSNTRNILDGQVSLFEEESKYNEEEPPNFYTIMPDISDKEKLNYEKEMLGIYVSGHPLDRIYKYLKKIITIDSRVKLRLQEEDPDEIEYKDRQKVVYAGIINSIKRKFTKSNKVLTFIEVEDIYRIF